MTEKEQIKHLADDVDKLIERYRTEYDLSYAAAVGVLQMKAHLLCAETIALREFDKVFPDSLREHQTGEKKKDTKA